MSGEQGLSKSDWRGGLLRILKVFGLRAGLIGGVLFRNLRLTHGLDRSWRKRYIAACRGLAREEAIFRPSRQWSIIASFYRLAFRAGGLNRFKSVFGRFLSTYEASNPWLFAGVHHLYRSALKPRDVWGLLDRLEEPALGEGTFIKYGGKRLSLDLLQSIDEFYRLREALDFKQDDPVVFCEVGAGYGRLADVVLSAMPRASFLIFDLPESLLLSQHYLTSLHPARKAALYPESEEVLKSGDWKGYGLVFGLPHQLRALKPGAVDAFINVYSFMEMSRAQIENYFQIIEDLKVGVLYIKQHKREANIFDSSLNTGLNYPIRPGWRQLHYGTSTLFEHVFEASYQVSGSLSRAQR